MPNHPPRLRLTRGGTVTSSGTLLAGFGPAGPATDPPGGRGVPDAWPRPVATGNTGKGSGAVVRDLARYRTAGTAGAPNASDAPATTGSASAPTAMTAFAVGRMAGPGGRDRTGRWTTGGADRRAEAAEVGDPAWIAVDLRAACQVRSVTVAFEPAAEGQAPPPGGDPYDPSSPYDPSDPYGTRPAAPAAPVTPLTLHVETSLDGSSWRTSYQAERHPGTGTVRIGLDEPVTARWVRMTTTVPDGGGPVTLNGFRVYGTCDRPRPPAVGWTVWEGGRSGEASALRVDEDAAPRAASGWETVLDEWARGGDTPAASPALSTGAVVMAPDTAATFLKAVDDRLNTSGSPAEFYRKAQLICYENVRAVIEAWNADGWRAADAPALLWMARPTPPGAIGRPGAAHRDLTAYTVPGEPGDQGGHDHLGHPGHSDHVDDLGHPGHPGHPGDLDHVDDPDPLDRLVAGFEADGAYYGARKASEPLHVQADPVDGAVRVVNRTAAPVLGATVTAQLHDLCGRPMGAAVARRIDIAAADTADAFSVPFDRSLPATHLLRLRLTGADGRLLSGNDYWRYRTATDMRSLNGLPNVRLSLSVRPTGPRGLLAAVRNTGTAPAAMVRLALRDRRSGERVQPVFADDNYFWLLPGESREVALSWETAGDAAGAPAGSDGSDDADTPGVEAAAYNATPVTTQPE